MFLTEGCTRNYFYNLQVQTRDCSPQTKWHVHGLNSYSFIILFCTVLVSLTGQSIIKKISTLSKSYQQHTDNGISVYKLPIVFGL